MGRDGWRDPHPHDPLLSPLDDDLADLVGDILGETARILWGEDDVDGASGGVVLDDVPIVEGDQVFDPEVEDKLDVGDGEVAELFGLEIINAHIRRVCKARAKGRGRGAGLR